jgi:hypothetical protein
MLVYERLNPIAILLNREDPTITANQLVRFNYSCAGNRSSGKGCLNHDRTMTYLKNLKGSLNSDDQQGLLMCRPKATIGRTGLKGQ